MIQLASAGRLKKGVDCGGKDRKIGDFDTGHSLAQVEWLAPIPRKDGQILTARGYGFADVEKRKPIDPTTTLFRPGSVSKLVTWTAVMQLVGEGKLDLDRDVNSSAGPIQLRRRNPHHRRHMGLGLLECSERA